MPPNPILKVIDSSQLELQWNIPYSYESDPIQHYDIQILNTSSGHKFDDSVTQNRYVYTNKNGNAATQCDLLMFNVVAVSALGRSILGNVSGGFPVGKHCLKHSPNYCYLISFNTAPRSFPSEINVAVMFYGNGTPIAKVSFEVSLLLNIISSISLNFSTLFRLLSFVNIKYQISPSR